MNNVRNLRAQVTIRSETYKTYVEIRNKAGFGDDDGFINHLLIASYYRTQGTILYATFNDQRFS